MTDPNLTTACLQVAGRLLTQREARNGYQSSHLALVNRSDLTLAMNLLATASTRIEGLEAAVDLQGAAAADANAQANAMRRMLGDALAVMECNDPRQPILAEMRAALGKAPATLPLEIAGSLLPDDYVSPRLAAEAYRENGAQTASESNIIEKVVEYGGHRENEGGSYATFQKFEARRHRADADEVLVEIRAMIAATAKEGGA